MSEIGLVIPGGAISLTKTSGHKKMWERAACCLSDLNKCGKFPRSAKGSGYAWLNHGIEQEAGLRIHPW